MVAGFFNNASRVRMKASRVVFDQSFFTGKGDKASFVYDFSKIERDSISQAEERAFKDSVKKTFSFTHQQLDDPTRRL